MKNINLRIRVAGGWAIALGLALAAACGGGEPAKGSGITTNGGTGGGGGSAGSTPCLALLCAQDQFTLATQIGDQCIVYCGYSSSGSAHTQGFFEGGEFFVETSSSGADAGVSLDGGSSNISYALIRIPDENRLGGHWLCAAAGSIDEPAQSGAAQTYTLSQLSDLGPCEGDAANTETLTISSSGSTPTVTGTVDGDQIVNSSSVSTCGLDRCDFPIERQAGQTAGFIAIRSEGNLTTGEAIPIGEAAWVAPRHLGYHLICGASGSITRTESGVDASFTGLSKKTCPGTPLAGTIQGKLSTDSSTSGGS